APWMAPDERDRLDDDASEPRPALAEPAAAHATEEVERQRREKRPERDGEDDRQETQVPIVRGESADQRRRLLPHDPHGAERDVRPHALQEAHATGGALTVRDRR